MTTYQDSINNSPEDTEKSATENKVMSDFIIEVFDLRVSFGHMIPKDVVFVI